MPKLLNYQRVRAGVSPPPGGAGQADRDQETGETPEGEREVSKRTKQAVEWARGEAEARKKEPRPTAHTHEYVSHPTWETHMTCRICGFSCPRRYVPKHLIVAEGVDNV